MAISEKTLTGTTWSIDPNHTLIEFGVKHMMVTTVKGRFTGVTGTIVGDLENPEGAVVEVDIDAASIDTRNEQRDGHLRSADFLDAENHPALSFRSTRIEKLNDEDLKVYGDLTIRGTTHPVVLDTTVNGAGKTPFGTEIIGISAETKINRKDFGLNWNVALETGGWLVGETVKISLEIEAVKGS